MEKKIIAIIGHDKLKSDKTGNTLRSAGYHTQAYAPEDTLPPEAVLLAVTLADVRGERLAGIVSQLRKPAEVPVVTLCRSREPIGPLLAMGVSDVLHLPATDRELLLRVSRVLERCDYRNNQNRLIAEIEAQNTKLSRYFSPKELKRILGDENSTAIEGEAAHGTFLMFDLRDSTGRAERMGAGRFFPFLTELFADLSDLVHGLDGTLSKFTGDGFLAIFGCPNHSRDAVLNALRCATRIRAHIEVFNSLLPPDDEPVRFGIGIATGLVYRGNIGNVHRLEFTVLGDAVNLASRLEQMTKQLGRDILVDGETIQMAADGVEASRLGLISVRGKEQKVEVYALQAISEFCSL